MGRLPGFKGYWSDHKLFKPSVFRDVHQWEGWQKTMTKINTPANLMQKAILMTLHQTGGRVSEVIQYGGKHFTEEDGLVLVHEAPLVKNKQLTCRWDFYIEKTEPPMTAFLEYIDRPSVKELLFPSMWGRKFISRQYVWHLCHDQLGVYPHWFRSMRAFCLTWFHRIPYDKLLGWFTWLDVETAMHYTRPDPKHTAQLFTKSPPWSKENQNV